jgi:hypothetical protein
MPYGIMKLKFLGKPEETCLHDLRLVLATTKAFAVLFLKKLSLLTVAKSQSKAQMTDADQGLW